MLFFVMLSFPLLPIRVSVSLFNWFSRVYLGVVLERTNLGTHSGSALLAWNCGCQFRWQVLVRGLQSGPTHFWARADFPIGTRHKESKESFSESLCPKWISLKDALVMEVSSPPPLPLLLLHKGCASYPPPGLLQKDMSVLELVLKMWMALMTDSKSFHKPGGSF